MVKNSAGEATAGSDYAQRMVRLRSARWKRYLDVQAPYRWNIRRLRLGRTLDIGCGIGRNLEHLGDGAVGVDHNADSIAVARERGLTAYTSGEFAGSADAAPESYDSLLFAHVLEHVDQHYAVGMVKDYLTYLKPGGQVVLITPQEYGYRADATHVNFVDFAVLKAIAAAAGLKVQRQYSFPLPRFAGNLFMYNEFVTVTRYPGAGNFRTESPAAGTELSTGETPAPTSAPATAPRPSATAEAAASTKAP